MSLSLLRLIPFFLALAAAAPAAAEPGRYYAENPEASVRRGWNVGVGLGGGEISCSGPGCDDVTEAGSLNLQLGKMLRPRLRAVLDLWGMAHKEEDFTVNQTLLTAGVQIWIINRLWLRGGVGIATAGFSYEGDLDDTEDERHSTIGLAGGIGFEVLSRRTFALDLELRGGTGFYDDKRAHNGAFNIGVTWY
ncbi:MAG TPA: outer membrane beta-barrel protein [Kofleriaceae bacterium]|jgi:hypothetical protein